METKNRHKDTSTFCSLHHNPIEQALRFYGYTLVGYACVPMHVCVHKNTVHSEAGNERMLKRWIRANRPGSISAPLHHGDSKQTRGEVQSHGSENRLSRKTISVAHPRPVIGLAITGLDEKPIQARLSFRSGEVPASLLTPAPAPRLCSGDGREAQAAFGPIGFYFAFVNKPQTPPHTNSVRRKRRGRFRTNSTFDMRAGQRRKMRLRKPDCSGGFYCPATLLICHILFSNLRVTPTMQMRRGPEIEMRNGFTIVADFMLLILRRRGMNSEGCDGGICPAPISGVSQNWLITS